jgi:uncharacterized membrane protein YukC
MFDIIAYLAQMLIYVIATLCISYCLFVIFKKPNPDFVVFNDGGFDYSKVAADIETLKTKLTEKNIRFKEAVAKVQIAELTAKIREKKLEIISKCSTINEKIVDYLIVEGEQVKKDQ